jgi:hypothetical protein
VHERKMSILHASSLFLRCIVAQLVGHLNSLFLLFIPVNNFNAQNEKLNQYILFFLYPVAFCLLDGFLAVVCKNQIWNGNKIFFGDVEKSRWVRNWVKNLNIFCVKECKSLWLIF